MHFIKFSLRKLDFVQGNENLFEIWSLLVIILPTSSYQY